jgi:hypothetical protein
MCFPAHCTLKIRLKCENNQNKIVKREHSYLETYERSLIGDPKMVTPRKNRGDAGMIILTGVWEKKE